MRINIWKREMVFLVLIVALVSVSSVDASTSTENSYVDSKLDGVKITGDEMCSREGLGKCIQVRKFVGKRRINYGDARMTCSKVGYDGWEWYAVCESDEEVEAPVQTSQISTGTSSSTITEITSALYGEVSGYKNRLNFCLGRTTCDYRVDHRVIGDPRPGVAKDFVVNYKCNGISYRATVGAEASGKNVVLDCRSTAGRVASPKVSTSRLICGDGKCDWTTSYKESCSSCQQDCGRCMPSLSSWCRTNCYPENSCGGSRPLNCGEGWTISNAQGNFRFSTMCCKSPIKTGEQCGSCEGAALCGDGKVSGNEVCDDGNIRSGDGCSSNCRAVEANYVCPTQGRECLCISGHHKENGVCVRDCIAYTDCGNRTVSYGVCSEFTKTETTRFSCDDGCGGEISGTDYCWKNADFDKSGCVDWEDYDDFSNNYQSRNLKYDLNSNGAIDFNDFNIFGEYFSAGCTGSLNDAPVVDGVAYFSGDCLNDGQITIKCDAYDPNPGQSGISLNVTGWVGTCDPGDCFNTRTWNFLRGEAMDYISENTFETKLITLDVPVGKGIVATCQAVDYLGLTSNWGDAYPLSGCGAISGCNSNPALSVSISSPTNFVTTGEDLTVQVFSDKTLSANPSVELEAVSGGTIKNAVFTSMAGASYLYNLNLNNVDGGRYRIRVSGGDSMGCEGEAFKDIVVCGEGTHMEGASCVSNIMSCTGVEPVLVSGMIKGPSIYEWGYSPTKWGYYSATNPATTSTPCKWRCEEGYNHIGNTCDRNNCSSSGIPSNAMLCPGDDINVTFDNFPISVVSSCTAGKCQYLCNDGYHKYFNDCVSDSCLGNVTVGVGVRLSSSRVLAEPKSWSYTDNFISTQTCTWSCEEGYNKDGNGCVNYADFDLNGCVDYSDLNLLVDYFGSSNVLYDLDKNGVVNENDFELFKNNFGAGCVNVFSLTDDVCIRECDNAGDGRCSGRGYQTCGNYDEDTCLEWGSITNCPTTVVDSYCRGNSLITRRYSGNCINDNCQILEASVSCGQEGCREVPDPSCNTPTCSDGILNQGETYVDCGGDNCKPCSIFAGDAVEFTKGTEFSCGNMKYGEKCSVDLELRPEGAIPGSSFKFSLRVDSDGNVVKETGDFVIKIKEESSGFTGSVVKDIFNENGLKLISASVVSEGGIEETSEEFKSKYSCEIIPNSEVCCTGGYISSKQDPLKCVKAPEEYCADISRDGKVNFADFTLFSDCFGKTSVSCAGSDINMDGVVNFDDFFIFVDYLGEENVVCEEIDIEAYMGQFGVMRKVSDVSSCFELETEEECYMVPALNENVGCRWVDDVRSYCAASSMSCEDLSMPDCYASVYCLWDKDGDFCYSQECEGELPSTEGVIKGSSFYEVGGMKSWSYRPSAAPEACEWNCRHGYTLASDGNGCVVE